MQSVPNLVDAEGRISYNEVIKQHPWIVKEKQNCILSPDSDGLLCGLLMSYLFDWNIVGFYDGKVLAVRNDIQANDCVFLDMEIFRDCAKSLGQHMLLWNKKKIPSNWDNFRNCISPNNIRMFDGKSNFSCKYPLGSIHILLGIVNQAKKVDIKKDAICPLLYVDGTFKNLFNYPENCLDWLEFLCAGDENNPLNVVFFNDEYSTMSLMLALKDFFAKLKGMCFGKRGADKIVISDRNGKVVNITNGTIETEQQKITDKFLSLLSDLTGWTYDKNKWTFDELRVFVFSKGTITPNQREFDALMSKNPLSWAMTSTLAIEYTVDDKNSF